MSAPGVERPLGTATANIDGFLGAIGTEQFFSDIWGKRPAIFTLEPNEQSYINGTVGPLEIERLASLASEGSQAWLATEYIGHSVIPVDSTTARQYFDVGATLYFLNIPLPALTDRIADVLGAPRRRVIASVFLTPPKSGAVPHFDKNENFTIQLTGRKSWRVSTSPIVSNPHKSHVFGETAHADLVRLGADLDQIVPEKEYALTPGTILYVPRGVTHSTYAEDASWSLNISYTGLVWADLAHCLYDHLLANPEWRRSVVGLGDQSSIAAKKQNVAPELLVELGKLLADQNLVRALCDDLLSQNKK
jgi:ribosomal protein L16 Arg81 hydroxylase